MRGGNFPARSSRHRVVRESPVTVTTSRVLKMVIDRPPIAITPYDELWARRKPDDSREFGTYFFGVELD